MADTARFEAVIRARLLGKSETEYEVELRAKTSGDACIIPHHGTRIEGVGGFIVSAELCMDSAGFSTESGPFVSKRRADYDWFYSDPARVDKFAGQWVAILNGSVVGHGTALQAAQAANHALVLYVPPREQQADSELGL